MLDPSHEAFAEGRTARLPNGADGCLVLFMLPFLLAGVLFTSVLVKEIREFVLLTTDYGETEGTFVSRREDDSGDSTQYYVTFRFVMDERVYTVEHSVRRIVFETVADGPFTVRYARADPTVAAIEAPSAGRLLGIGAFMLIWDTAVVAIAGRSAHQLFKRRAAARDGVWLQGEVVRANTELDDDGDRVLEIITRFRSIDTGAWIETRDRVVRNDLEGKPVPPAGTPVHVLYRDDQTWIVL